MVVINLLPSILLGAFLVVLVMYLCVTTERMWICRKSRTSLPNRFVPGMLMIYIICVVCAFGIFYCIGEMSLAMWSWL